ncbi:TatD family hydrolase [archaeon]|jgi:TatD DNase family protein|nr:TatD family hydrolase [archaeon]MBT3451471.1 TatD family hydrolase [archaeon]MBT6868535.1 TatD family hydrolase [archaeon]MBT7193069.1 TatD family hydrolase [archaeon]MBT7381158.1 TatD family hydrolase [archaeon]
MSLVDVHCHLNHALFKDNMKEILERAKQAGIKAIVVSGVNPAANKDVLELAEKINSKKDNDNILKVSLGIYPIDALGLSEGETGLPRNTEKINLEKEFKFIEKNKNKIVAVGEVGLDFHWDKLHHNQQKENFRKIIRFVKSINKPIVIHSRKAEKECIDILEEELPNKDIPVIMHCFSGNKKLIKRATELGHYFSVPPNIVKLQHFQTLVEMVPLNQLFTETDAPWLSPFPDKRNEPSFVIETIKKMAEIKEITEEEVEKQIWNNYVKVFGE